MNETEKILVLDRGGMELIYPGEWSAHPEPTGVVVLQDPDKSLRLEVLFGRLSRDESAEATLLPVDDVLRHFLEEVPETKRNVVIKEDVQPDGTMARAHYTYESESGAVDTPEAHARWLVARNPNYQIVLTLRYDSKDAPFATAAWERIIETLHLGDGVPLASPDDHWSLRKPN
jgi:hypothetical protein